MLASLLKTCPKFASSTPLKQQNLIEFAVTSYLGCIRDFSLTTQTNKCSGRYGGRLVKKWEEKEYTTKPLKVWRTGGRLPTTLPDGRIVPGKVWNSRIGGGHDRYWHWVDHNRMTVDEVNNGIIYQEKVLKIIEDDNRSGHIALVAGPLKKRWVMCTDKMKVGDNITNCAKMIPGAILNSGDAYPVGLLPNGTIVCCLEFFPGKGAQIARSAGNFCTISKHVGDRTLIMMPSKREINVDSNCVAVIGRVSNAEHEKERWTPFKRRWYGLRPHYGIQGKIGKDGRSGRKILPPMPTVVVGDRSRIYKSSHLED